MRPVTTIEISKEYLHFAAAHFTLFDANNRENLHGHNFHVALEVTAPVDEGGITFDYNILKTAVKSLCDSFDEQVLMPTLSPWLTIEEAADYTWVNFANERIPFLSRDILLVPVRNITVEELSRHLLERIVENPDIAALDIHAIKLRCSSGEGQWAWADWLAPASRQQEVSV